MCNAEIQCDALLDCDGYIVGILKAKNLRFFVVSQAESQKLNYTISTRVVQPALKSQNTKIIKVKNA